ncbi:ArnT family glycosyltransferase [Pelagicoccus mobilis]|uniref:Glycosyltransferase family 39 protein n=1 Tax=Pelagicoccus mobilis TaxID=415221 RepID=A0A934RXK6_9BACT|nr:glycosyltransferase family 39 protein [Pelagicoccus mobilis]MBK1875739.1 glycosyltransferase family 39 protein [Pelagicoccus mobilis]
MPNALESNRWSPISKYLLVGVLLVVAHLPFRSVWFDDQDSIHFALAIEELNLLKHQPHPPGYAAYVYTARAIDSVLDDPQLTLTLLSVFTGVGCILLVFSLGKWLVDWKVGLIAAAVMLVAPARMQTSLVAMNDIVAVFFLLLSIRLGLNCRKGGIWFPVLSGLALGWTVGVRPQLIIMGVAFALVLIVYCRLWSQRGLFVAGGLVGTLAWLVPISLGHGSFSRYYQFSQKQYQNHPDVRAQFDLESVVELWGLFSDRWEWVLGGLVLCGLVVFLWDRLGASREGEGEKRGGGICLALVVLWFAIASFSVLQFHPLHLHRVTVMMLPSAALILGMLLRPAFSIDRRNLFSMAVVALLLVLFVGQTVSTGKQAYRLRTFVPAPIQTVLEVERMSEAESTVVFWFDVPRFVQWYLPDYKMYLLDYESKTVLPALNAPGVETILSPGDILFSGSGRLLEHSRDYEIYSAHAESRAYLFESDRLNLIPLEGFHHKERTGLWTEDRFTGFIRGTAAGDADLYLTIRSGLDEERVLDISIEGELCYSKLIGTSSEELVIPLPLDRKWKRIEFVSRSGCDSPKDLGHSNDTRCMAFWIQSMAMGPTRFEVGDTLSFDEEGGRFEYLGEGWADPEEGWVWSDEKRVEVGFPVGSLPDGDLKLDFDAHYFLGDESDVRKVNIYANGELVSSDRIANENHSNPSCIVPKSLLKDERTLKLVFEFEDLRSPKDFGLSDDSRLLGISLRKIFLRDTNDEG